MIKIFLFAAALSIQITVTLFINLRLIQAFKKGVDVKCAFEKQDMNLKKALEYSKHYNEILERG